MIQKFNLCTRNQKRVFGVGIDLALTMAVLAVALTSCEKSSNPLVSTDPPHAEGTVNPPTLDSIKGSPWRNIVLDTILNCFVSDSIYDSLLRIHLSSITEGAIIHYTIDGRDPTKNSSIYPDSGIKVDSSLVLKAMATRAGWNSSELLVHSFEFKAKPPTFERSSLYPWTHSYDSTHSTPVYDQPFFVVLKSQEPGVGIRYTTDGSTPTSQSNLVKDSIWLDSSCTLTAIATKSGWENSAPLKIPVILQTQPVTIGPSGQNLPPFRVGMSSPTRGVAIRYTTDSSAPTRSSSLFLDSLPFGTHDFGINYRAIATDTLHPKIRPSKIVGVKIDQMNPWNATIPYGTITDARDGHLYRTVKIGNQTWMAENLDYKVDSSWCPQDRSENCAAFGRLYSWTASMGLENKYNDQVWNDTTTRQGLCPEDFHMPNDSEWTKLSATAEANPKVGPGYAGLALQAKQNNGWSFNGIEDPYGFRGVMSGWRDWSSEFGYLHSYAFFWSATQDEWNPSRAANWCFQNQASNSLHETRSKRMGFSVRCVRDR